MISKINSNLVNNYYNYGSENRTYENSNKKINYNSNIQTSIYNKKGVNIPFGCLAKGIDGVEEACIRLLRKQRQDRLRKFDENDIKTILIHLRKFDNCEDKYKILDETLNLTEYTDLPKNVKSKRNKNIMKSIFNINVNNSTLKFNGKVLKNLISIISGKPEKLRMAVIDFAFNDIHIAKEPLQALSNLPEDKQINLCKILEKISDINDKSLFIDDKSRIKTVNSLYETFRTAVYKHDDLLKGMDSSTVRNDALNDVSGDIEYFNMLENYTDDTSKEKVLNIALRVLQYIAENIV